ELFIASVVGVSECCVDHLRVKSAFLAPGVHSLFHAHLHTELDKLPQFARFGLRGPRVHSSGNATVFPGQRRLLRTHPTEVLDERGHTLGQVRMTSPDRGVNPPLRITHPNRHSGMHHHQTHTVLHRIRRNDLNEPLRPGDTHIQDVSLDLYGLHVPQLGGVSTGQDRSNSSAYLTRTHHQVPHRPPSAACAPRGLSPSSRRCTHAAIDVP